MIDPAAGIAGDDRLDDEDDRRKTISQMSPIAVGTIQRPETKKVTKTSRIGMMSTSA